MNELTQKIFSTARFGEIESRSGKNLFLTGINGSIKSFVISYLFQVSNKKIIYCSNNRDSLFKLKDDINLILGTDTASIYITEYDEEYETEVSPLSLTLKKLSACDDFILLVEQSVFQKETISEEKFRAQTLALRKGEEQVFNELITRLIEFGFERKQMVEEENDFAVRGGIIDVFPENLDQPVRLEFFGNIIESIREFDLVTQRSISHLDNAEILPSPVNFEVPDNKARVLDYLKENHLILVDEPDIVKEKDESIFNNLIRFPGSYFSVFPLAKSESILQKELLKEIMFNSQSQPTFRSNLKLLFENLKDLTKKNFQVFVTASDQYQTNRFKELIDELDENDELTKIIYRDNSIHEGFVLPEEKIAVYTEHQIFERYYRPVRRKRKLTGISFKDLTRVNNGDFMVHHNFGIGKYAGLRRINVGGVEQEAVKLLYKDNDAVFVNLNSLNLIKKYSAQEGHIPKLNKLGGSEWERIKQRTKKKIQDIARDLILLYSKRKSVKGFKFSSDGVWQKELEASFIYEDTPDQITATDAVKKDMETESPMDRLICGDVGFGKTEVAVRAAFKCVLDNKQTAVLVPTTILAEQHYNTFKDRLTNWAVDVDHFSRFKTKLQQKEILEKLEKGRINIIIGTHRLLSKDVRFKDLGLLIIDEEQRFGVAAKEKLKFMRETVDVLTLTATPIPRTLNFSLLGARDFSIINTPPKNRQPIHTEIINFDKKIIASSVTRELQRDGQVYLVNDKISRLEELAEMIEEVVPFAKVAVAHGQMNSRELENVMMKFLEKKYNVLVCTKIIESGLDIPSVNTIIINRADNFGLAELYQLRGRVGRSNIKSFAYLITPPNRILTRQAVRRLHALEEFTELGSGLNLALRDLEIRGAGNLLGKEQSGFIAEMGFDMYMKILDEAVNELKGSEFGAVFSDIISKDKQARITEPEVKIETDISMLIPGSYIEDENTRLVIYQRLSGTNTIDELNPIAEETKDRFGKFPEEVASLFKHVELKIACMGSGFEKVEIQGNTAKLYFLLSEESKILKEGRLEQITAYISGQGNMKMVQTKTSLILQCNLFNYDKSIERLEEVIEVIKKLKMLS